MLSSMYSRGGQALVQAADRQRTERFRLALRTKR